jgi:phosphoglycolate phosphatase-like HAD superfamily hydrolase
MKTFDSIIFDWDGTLANTPEVLARAFKEVLVKRGLFLTDRHYKYFMMGDWVNGLARYGVTDPIQCTEEVMGVFTRNIGRVKLYSQVTQTLKTLRGKGKKIALVTTTPREYITKTDILVDISHYFDVVLTQEQVGHNKLNLFVLDVAIKSLKAKKENTLFVGNTQKDVVVGKEFGITTVIFYPKENEKFYDKKEILAEKPAQVITYFAELIKIAK